MDCSLPALVASHSQMVSLVSDGEGKGAGGNGFFFLFFYIDQIKILCSIKKEKKRREKRIQEVWQKVMPNLEFEAEIKEILLLWADESGSEFGSRSEIPHKWWIIVFM